MSNRLYLIIFLTFFLFNFLSHFGQEKKPPNVILIITDDQGIGDLSCHGNPWLKTPNLDAFYERSVRLTDFHVSPVCTPTRAAIMTGRYPINNGAWATYKGRDALSEGASTMADIFRQNGYNTAMFGKWHLGDNYPVRATDLGFDYAVQHKAGGVGELSDYWGNSYFDDVYYVNNQPRQFKGYCTDVWFEEAMKYIDTNQDNPFFVYLSTNAPHSPWIVDDRYSTPYQKLEGNKIVSANFYGMIANIDENFGKLHDFLQDTGLLDNTILIFMTDNGSSGGISRDGTVGYNKGFRGMKGHKTEGGHRVPFFIRWKDGRVKGGRNIADLTAHIDILPTLASMCDLKVPEGMELDGIDISPLFQNDRLKLPDRTVFVHHSQDWRPPLDEDQTCIMNEKWRLVNGNELYDIDNDQYQEWNVAREHPGVVKELLDANRKFVASAKSGSEYQQFPVNVIGNKNQNEIKLTIQHAIGEGPGIWKSQQVADGMKNINNTHALKIEQSGMYRIECRRWPKEYPGPINGVPGENPKNLFDYKTIAPEKIQMRIANQILEKAIGPDDEAAVFEVALAKGKTFLVTDFIEGDEKYGVYYTYIEYLGTE